MSFETIFPVVLGAVMGGFINGLAGFGTALFALGFFLKVMTPEQAVAVVVILSVISGLQGLWVVRGAIWDRAGRMARFVVPGLVGIPLGLLALSVIEARTLKLVIAGFLLLYGGFFTLRRSLPRFERPTPVADVGVGFLGGILGGAASLSGALPTMWCSMRPWPKAETRAVLQPFNVVILGVTALMLALRGVYDGQTLLYLAVALPCALLSAQIGITVFKRLSDDLFRRLLIGMCLVSGTILMLREVL
ncbi:sulfite exporter TauE/SafE family protein [Roseovarius sp. PS-C2]|uniref:sulfite exporter TauE/SafE family protein n=1 Tax=Roseovarius sp. PS-C2 TaxID=2820814 RepID=UPI001C0E2E54|nr:sulfite exporter TauE/SafE family protein [Roseovarius sp. PS-C2]MBU3259863.1 sulfite exporter TauE/SafE family protein [Roseovarius sp. PS-C2]